ncbi:MAG TPA: ABC transporter permease, partial [Chthoniobacteraceae bacterium]|nr:ABC transporter permease [Chthoniobacteraceae bacterium]
MSLFLHQLGNELKKMFARKRTYIGFGAFLAMEFLILVLVNTPPSQRRIRHMIEENGYAFDQYFSGLTLAFDIISTTSVMLGSLFLALVSGDLMAKEVEDGTLRMMLCRPVARSRVVILKYISCVIYTIALILFIAVTGLLAGLLYRGWGGMFVFSPLERIFALHDATTGFHCYIQSVPLLALSMVTV